MSEIGVPVQKSISFGLVTLASGGSQTLATVGGLIFGATSAPSSDDPTQLVASITVTTDQADTCYTSLDMIGGNVLTFGPADGAVTVASYDAGCGQPGGPFFLGGIQFSLVKPSGVAVNGILGCGVGVLGGPTAFTGVIFQ
jgi:hypothetical protein